jgi:hypothetical protein
MRHPQFEDGSSSFRFLFSAKLLLTAALLLALPAFVHAQQKELPVPDKPTRVFTVQGQVSLPEGMPARQILVTLISGEGVPRQTYTTEQGRYEFLGIPEGNYTLSAKSLSDSNLVSESVETDTNRTATGNLNVNLSLRRESSAVDSSRSPEVLTTAEAGQRVPKEARQAFKQGLKFRRDNQPDKALARYSRAVELYSEYFQALAERGDLLVSQRKLPEAAADFARALKINPHYAPALRGAGYCKLESQEFAEAIEYLQKATTAEPNNANTYLLLGIAHLELDHREAARLALFKALSFNSQHESRAYIYLGKLYAREHLFKEAADQLQRYLEANPTASDAAEIKEIESKWRAQAATTAP